MSNQNIRNTDSSDEIKPGSGHNEEKSTAAPPKAGKPKGKSGKGFLGLDLDLITILLMAKGALAPTIVLAMAQATSIASMLGTLGYLSAIISLFSMPILPRAKYLQGLVINATGMAIAVAGSLLTIYCVTEARRHTSPPATAAAGAPVGTTPSQTQVPYNASASAVAAVWLFFWIWLGNVVRHRLPQAQQACIMFCILTTVSTMNSPLFPTMTYAITFIKTLLKAVFLGLGIATGVALFIVPVASRTIVGKIFTGLLMSIKGCLTSYGALLKSFESEDAMADMLVADREPRAEVKAARAAIKGTSALQAKLQVELPFAKREVGIGKLGPDDMKELNERIRFVLLPTLGLESITGLFQHFAVLRNWTEERIGSLNPEEQADRDAAVKDWISNMQLVHKNFAEIIGVMKDAIDHVLIRLELIPTPKDRTKKAQDAKAEDVESTAQTTAPGTSGFAEYLDRKSSQFYSEKHLTLVEWGRRRGITWPDNFFDHPDTAPIDMPQTMDTETKIRKQQNQRQLYLLLYMEFLLFRMSRSLLDMVLFVDGLVANGHMKRNRLIIPSLKRIRRLFMDIFARDNISSTDGAMRDHSDGSHQVYMGASYDVMKDPEHLAPTNAYQRAGDLFRQISVFLESSAAAFGFRAAVAAMAVAIPAFLRDTQHFSNQYRLFWAVIMVAISMSPTAGQSLFGFLLRSSGTVIAMLLSWVTYYVAGNGKTPGILVLYWFFAACGLYMPLKKPQFLMIGIISSVTLTLIIGYELEARKLGKTAIAASGQVYLGILVFAPVRLATVLAGLFVGFIFTIFPYPISEHSQLRRDLGASLYMLANYYSSVHETMAHRIKGDYNTKTDKNDPARRLEKVRIKLFTKQLLMINSMKTYSNFSRWEIPIGGKFPKKQYDDIITSIENITNYMSLISYASMSFSYLDDSGKISQWARSFRQLVAEVGPTSHETIMLLTLLSGAIRDGRPLPPYMPSPSPYQLSEKLEKMDEDILSIRHINEPGYAAFAVLQLAARCIVVDMETLVARVKDLVGEMDFGFHVVDSVNSSVEGIEVDKNKNKHD
ncbi:hypothetical protein BT63DRAFT_427445 [Microthyrium microscopicum]|uniref:ER transporter 6TM N-terminal domain-containing protein n=1 Tax=Microthyrium microscopicum TaxID=703497 RepID=A0A6A6U5W5_9PEZI|nr:hypothetical protein BT63DRAFT_427445 [Microthyrium microscopicum]